MLSLNLWNILNDNESFWVLWIIFLVFILVMLEICFMKIEFEDIFFFWSFVLDMLVCKYLGGLYKLLFNVISNKID